MSNSGYRPFESLGKIKNLLSEKPLKQKLPRAEDDNELFLKAMAKVKEIKEFREIPYRTPKVSVRRSTIVNKKSAFQRLVDIARGRQPIDISMTQEYVEWVNPLYRKELSRLLHEGSFSVQDFLDLHGYSRAEAQLAMRDFLKKSKQKGLSCVKIIHGRGLRSVRGPVLKQAVCQWLDRDFRKYVIAYTTASRYDGGLGAVYVLLSRS